MHKRARKTLFAPTGSKSGPAVKKLSGARSTKLDYLDGSPSEHIGDDWLTPENQTRVMPKAWTGVTIFPDHDKTSQKAEQASS